MRTLTHTSKMVVVRPYLHNTNISLTVQEINAQTSAVHMHILLCAICLRVCFMDLKHLKHLSIDYILLCDYRNAVLSYTQQLVLANRSVIHTR